MRNLTAISLAIIIIFSGCIGVPFVDPPPQDEPAPVKVVNNDTMTTTFEIIVIPVGNNLTIHLENGNEFNMTIRPGSGTQIESAENPSIKIEYPDSARHHGTYTLEPGEENLSHVENVAPTEAIVVLVYNEEEGRYRAIKSLSCEAEIKGYKVETRPEGDDYTPGRHACGGISTWFDRTPPEPPRTTPPHTTLLVERWVPNMLKT